MMTFNPGQASSDSFGWSFLPATSTTHVGARRLDTGGWWNTGQKTLAPANTGWYLITWTHANRRDNPQLSLRAAIGHKNHVGPTSTVVSLPTHVAGYVGATGGHGDAIILFNGSTDTGDGASWPYTSGLYATVHR
jgi:hypothetical protein